MKDFIGTIFVLSGPSGSGKTTLAQRVVSAPEFKTFLKKSISLTTRLKRSGEYQGKDYYFVAEQDFKDYLHKKKILEWTRYLGYYYATPKDKVEQVLLSGKSLVLCLDGKGATRIKRIYPDNSVTIFIKPPSIGELNKRIRSRGCKTRDEEIKKRLAIAKQEIKVSANYDYIIVNKNLDTAVNKLNSIIRRYIKAR